MKPYYEDDQTTLYLGDALEVLRTLPDASVDCCVTSPPYFGLRSYGVAPTEWPDVTYAPMLGLPPIIVPAMSCALGAEPDPFSFVAHLRVLLSEARRVLANDGTLWLNMGDSYYSGRGNPGPNSDDKKNVARRGWERANDKPGATWAKPKDLLLIPARVGLALQADGWTVRNNNIWAKPNGMPESVTDRLSTKHEHLFLFAKSRRYWFDLDPIREPHVSEPGSEGENCLRGQKAIRPVGPNSGSYSDGGRNPGDVWTIATQPFSEAHFAVFPVEIPRRAIAAGCKPGGVVLDPFSGSGTTGLAASQLGRKYVGIDLNRDYLDLSLRTRLAQPSLTAEGIA